MDATIDVPIQYSCIFETERIRLPHTLATKYTIALGQKAWFGHQPNLRSYNLAPSFMKVVFDSMKSKIRKISHFGDNLKMQPWEN